MPEIKFSTEEYNLVRNHQIFDIKATIINKIHVLFSQIEENINQSISVSTFQFPDHVLLGQGKISKGENYQNCPYVVLDYPRLFSKKDIFTFRTIFWWGHYFSNSFIIAGKSYQQYVKYFIEKSEYLNNSNWYICTYKTPWRLENEENNYIQLSKLSIDKLLNYLDNKHFIKIARIYPIDDYQLLKSQTNTFFMNILDILK